jgi:hypothetical protein
MEVMKPVLCWPEKYCSSGTQTDIQPRVGSRGEYLNYLAADLPATRAERLSLMGLEIMA